MGKTSHCDGSIRSCVILLNLFYLVTMVTSYQIVDLKQTPSPAKVGQTLQLKCIASSWVEICLWRRNGQVCKFEWNKNRSKVNKQICGDLGKVVKFIGIYDTHDCSVQIGNAAETDAGIWTCETESTEVNPGERSRKDGLNLTVLIESSPQPRMKESTLQTVTETYRAEPTEIVIEREDEENISRGFQRNKTDSITKEAEKIPVTFENNFSKPKTAATASTETASTTTAAKTTYHITAYTSKGESLEPNRLVSKLNGTALKEKIATILNRTHTLGTIPENGFNFETSSTSTKTATTSTPVASLRPLTEATIMSPQSLNTPMATTTTETAATVAATATATAATTLSTPTNTTTTTTTTTTNMTTTTTTTSITTTTAKTTASTTLKCSTGSPSVKPVSSENYNKQKKPKHDPTLVSALVGSFVALICLLTIAAFMYFCHKRSMRIYNVEKKQLEYENSVTFPHSRTEMSIPLSSY